MDNDDLIHCKWKWKTLIYIHAENTEKGNKKLAIQMDNHDLIHSKWKWKTLIYIHTENTEKGDKKWATMMDNSDLIHCKWKLNVLKYCLPHAFPYMDPRSHALYLVVHKKK